MLGHRVAFLALLVGAFSPNMLPILKLYSVAGRSRLVFSTDIRILSTTHIGSTLKILVVMCYSSVGLFSTLLAVLK